MNEIYNIITMFIYVKKEKGRIVFLARNTLKINEYILISTCCYDMKNVLPIFVFLSAGIIDLPRHPFPPLQLTFQRFQLDDFLLYIINGSLLHHRR